MSSLHITYVGGPTALIELAGVRFLTDPTLDPGGTDYPTPAYTLHKTQSPAIAPNAIGRVDAVLLSHDHHFDNLDNAGRASLARASATFTTQAGAERLGGSAVGLTAWESVTVASATGGSVRITATPARHGPPSGDRGPVIGFVLESSVPGDPVVYFSGDTVWFEGVEEVGRRFDVDVAILNVGAAMVAVAGPHPLTFTASDAVTLARAWPRASIVPLHFEGWTHFTEGRAELQAAFDTAGLGARLQWLEPGRDTARAPLQHRVDKTLLRPVECGTLRRFGGPHDGGYVVPVEAIAKASTLLAFGISIDWSFERAAAALNPQLTIHAYDHTVRGRRFVQMGLRSSFITIGRALVFNRRGASESADRVRRSIDYFRFFRGRVRHHRRRVWYNDDRGSASIDGILADTGPHAPLSIFAKIDIEGSEYRILPYIAERAELFTGLVIEFHDTDICAGLFNEELARLEESFVVAHVHGNNYGDLSVGGELPVSLEVTLFNKRLLAGAPAPYLGPLPRPGLDAPNDARRPDYVLDLSRAGSPQGSATRD